MFYKVFRTIRLTVFLALAATLPGQVFAIGLGEIRLNSPLNEPLDAEIQLLQVQDLDESELLIGIAPREDFEAAGVERLFFLSSLRFTLELDNPKGPLIRVRTEEVVREPYLNFLVEVQWPSGRLLREYTLLMDLPTFAEARSAARTLKAPETSPVVEQPVVKPALDVAALEAELAAVEATTVDAPAPVVSAPVAAAAVPAPAPEPDVEPVIKEEPVEPEQPAPAESPAAPEYVTADAPVPVDAVAPVPAPAAPAAPAAPVFSSAVAAGDYSIQPGDNLWSIAVKYRQGNDCTSREYKCAADGITVQQAMVAIQRLNPDAFIKGNINMLKKGKVLALPTQDQITDITSREAVAEVRRQNIEWSGNADGRKGTPAIEQIDATRQDAEVAAAPVEAEDGQLKLSVPGAEQTAKNGQAGDPNKARLESLQNELAIGMEEIDRSKREKADIKGQISALDEQTQTMKQMLEVRSAELAALQKSLAEKPSDTSVTPTESVEPAAAEVAPGDTTGAVEPPVAEEKPVTEEPVKPAPASSSFLMDNLVMILGGIGTLVVLAVVALVLRKRKTSTPKPVEESFEEAMLDETPSFDAADEREAEPMEEIDSQQDESFDVADDFDLDIGSAEPEPEAKQETGDAISEADIYISFGTYDKAESLLKAAIASEPKRTDLQLKLLEVYTAMDNLAAFDKQYQDLARLGDEGANERAQSLRGKISGAGESIVAASDSDDLGLDLDLGGEDLKGESLSSESSGLDFDLDLNFDEEPKAESSFGSNFSQAPTVQQPALDLSQMQTAVSPAVKVSEARTESRPSIDLDLDTDLTNTQSREVLDLEAQQPAVAEVSDGATVDEDFDFLADADEASTKLDLARAYIDMGDKEGARDILQEVLEEGQEAQKQEARKLLDSIG